MENKKTEATNKEAENLFSNMDNIVKGFQKYAVRERIRYQIVGWIFFATAIVSMCSAISEDLSKTQQDNEPKKQLQKNWQKEQKQFEQEKALLKKEIQMKTFIREIESLEKNLSSLLGAFENSYNWQQKKVLKRNITTFFMLKLDDVIKKTQRIIRQHLATFSLSYVYTIGAKISDKECGSPQKLDTWYNKRRYQNDTEQKGGVQWEKQDDNIQQSTKRKWHWKQPKVYKHWQNWQVVMVCIQLRSHNGSNS